MKKFVEAEVVELDLNKTESGRIDCYHEVEILGGFLPMTSYNDNKANKEESKTNDPTNEDSNS